MLEMQQTLSLSPYSALYDILIPKDHFLRQVHDMVDFSFVEQELLDKYCLNNGRMAEPPVRMFKYLFLKVYYDLSDRDVVERARFDISFDSVSFFSNLQNLPILQMMEKIIKLIIII